MAASGRTLDSRPARRSAARAAPTAAAWLRRTMTIGEDSARASIRLAGRLREDLTTLQDDLTAGRTTLEHVRAAAAGTAGLDPDLVASLCAEATDHAVRRELEDEQRIVVDKLGVPTYELPRLAGGVDAGGLLELAELMREQGLA